MAKSLRDLTRGAVSGTVLWKLVEKSLDPDVDIYMAVIRNTALIEMGLERHIRARLRLLNSDDNNALFGPRGAFNGLAAKIRMAYAMGIIGPKVRHDLAAINDIRNVFAHSGRKVSLATKSLQTKILSIHLFRMAVSHNHQPDFTPAGWLIFTTGLLAMYLGHDRPKRIAPKQIPSTFLRVGGKFLLQ